MEKQVTLSDGTTVTVKKLALGKFGELLLAFEGAFNKFKDYPDVGNITNNEFVALIPRLLTDAMPEVEKAIRVVSDLPADYEIGIEEATDILVALVETNDIGKIFSNVKKLLTLRTNPAVGATSEASPNGLSSEPTSSPASTAGQDATS